MPTSPTSRTKPQSETRRKQAAIASAEAFNHEFPVGTTITYFLNTRNSSRHTARTTGPATTLESSGTPVVPVTNFAGLVPLNQIVDIK